MTQMHRLPVVTSSVAERHPQDGWIFADPMPLGARSRRSLRGLIDALLPPAPAPRPEGIEERVALHVRRMLQYMPPALRLGFVLLTHLLDFAPLWRLQAPHRLHKLSPHEASAVLAGVATSRFLPLRLMMLAPKAVILSTYYDQDEVHAALDYAPKAFIRERVSYRDSLLRVAATETPHRGAAE